MSKATFLRKKPMQGVGERVLNGTLLAGSATAGMYAYNKLIKPESKFKKYAGLVGIGLHLGAEVFLEQPQLLAAARGLGAAGAIHTTGNLILPGSKADFGLAGEETIQRNEDDTPAWAKLAQQAEEEQAQPGAAYNEPVNGYYANDDEPAYSPRGMGANEAAAINMLMN